MTVLSWKGYDDRNDISRMEVARSERKNVVRVVNLSEIVEVHEYLKKSNYNQIKYLGLAFVLLEVEK